MDKFFKGDQIRWKYLHCFGRARAWRVKRGIFIGYIKSRHDCQKPEYLALVQFDGNRYPTRIPIKELSRPNVD